MSSPLLALFARSVREDTRGTLTYFARAGLVLVILLFMFFTQAQMGWSNAPGLRFFSSVVMINGWFIVLAGLSYFASAITEEKEEMTLGLLRMTNLNPLSILLGKSTSRLLGALLLLAVQLPFTLLAVSLGGVSIGQIVAAYCTLGAFTVMLCNLSLLASVVCRRSGAAATFTGVALFSAFIIVPILNFIVSVPKQAGIVVTDEPWVVGLRAVADWLNQASPFTRLTSILSTGFAEGPWCLQVASNLAVGVGCFLVAWLIFDVFCDEQPESGPPRGAVAKRTSAFRRFGARRAWGAALAWKDFYFLAGGKLSIFVKFVVYALPVLAALCWPAELGGRPDPEGFCFMFLFWMGMALVAELAFMAAKIFRVERQWKTLCGLSGLPMSTQRIAYQKILGFLPSLIPVLTYIVLAALVVRKEILEGLSDLNGEGLLVISYLLANLIFFLHLVAWLSLRMKRGALAAAIGIQFISQFFLGMFLGMAFRSIGALVPPTVLCGFLAVVLHASIGERLETLAAEE